MSNRASSYGNPQAGAQLRRAGGAIPSLSELPIHALGNDFVVEGNGTISALPTLPSGVSVTLFIAGSPTFKNSARLICPAAQDYVGAPGDYVIARSRGGGVWQLYVLAASGSGGSTNKFVTPCGRLTLTTATPLTTSDVTAATTIFYTPYNGNIITLWNGTAWVPITFAETSFNLTSAGLAANTVFDIWGRISGGVLALDTTAWTSDLVRATAIGQQDGIDIKSGDPSRRLLGSFRTIGTIGQTEDSKTKRWVSNRYNEAPRHMQALETANSWSYQSTTPRQANANAANQLDMVCCVPRLAAAEALGAMSNSTTNGSLGVLIGVNSITADSSTSKMQIINPATSGIFNGKANWMGYLGAGRNFIAWLEAAFVNAGTMTEYGTAGSTILQTGITGVIAN